MKILIIIPAYNEQDSIFNVIRDIEKFCPYADKIVINDASTDRTKEILETYKIDYLDLPVNLGIGGGVQTGYIYAYENGYDIAIQMDGDGQHCASELYKILVPIQEDMADIVIGSRFIENKGFQSTFMRRIGIGILSKMVYICTGEKIKDVTSGFRAVNRKFIKIFSKEYAQDYPEPEAIIVASKYNGRIKEIPVVMCERNNGKSSISPIRSCYYMIKVSLAIILQKLAKMER